MTKANRLPKIYEEYLSYCLERQVSAKKISQTKRVLTALSAYLDKNDINL